MGGRQERRRRRTRAALLEAARALIAERGYHDTTVAAIAERADVGFGTFYLYFSDKAEVTRAVLAEGLAELREQLRRELAGPAAEAAPAPDQTAAEAEGAEEDGAATSIRPAPPASSLAAPAAAHRPTIPPRAALLTLLRFAYANRDLFKIVVGGQGAAELVIEAQRALRADVERALEAATEAGFIATGDTALLARFVVGAVSQAIAWWFDHDTPSPEVMAEHLDCFLLHGLAGASGWIEPRPPSGRIPIT